MKTLHAFMLATLVTPVAWGQTLEDRIASADGPVGFEFATHGNVCGDGYGIQISDDTTPGWNTRRERSGTHFRYGRGDEGFCQIAPARAVVEHEGKRVTSIRVSVGGSRRGAERELGRVPAEDVSRFLLAVAPHLEGRSADDALLGAAIADAPLKWQRLLEIARDDGASQSSRKASLFWLSREAAVAAVAGLGSVAEDDDAAASVRSDALFYLAQRRDGAGIDALIRVVRRSKSARIRKDAIWFLGQSNDPRAVELFAELLAGR